MELAPTLTFCFFLSCKCRLCILFQFSIIIFYATRRFFVTFFPKESNVFSPLRLLFFLLADLALGAVLQALEVAPVPPNSDQRQRNGPYAADAATPHQSGQARQLLLKEKPFGGRIFLHYKKVHSPSSVSLFARHLLPFGRRFLSLCALQETWLFLATTTLNHARFLHPTMPRGTPMQSARGVRSTTEGEKCWGELAPIQAT